MLQGRAGFLRFLFTHDLNGCRSKWAIFDRAMQVTGLVIFQQVEVKLTVWPTCTCTHAGIQSPVLSTKWYTNNFWSKEIWVFKSRYRMFVSFHLGLERLCGPFLRRPLMACESAWRTTDELQWVAWSQVISISRKDIFFPVVWMTWIMFVKFILLYYHRIAVYCSLFELKLILSPTQFRKKVRESSSKRPKQKKWTSRTCSPNGQQMAFFFPF